MTIISGVFSSAYDLFGKMAPFLLFGYFFAGILHVFIKTKVISAHLGGNSFKSVLKAALFGVPLPLCSCAVIPAALSLRKEGASRGAVLSFLISTPTTGADSILATYSLLGAFFTVYRIAASFITGIFSGVLANIFLRKDKLYEEPVPEKCDKCAADTMEKTEGVLGKVKGVFRYAYIDLLKDTGPSLLLGIFLGGVIFFLMPKDLVEAHLGYGILPMIVMLIVGLPMYVCATASIPIAAALMLKGLAPGAAFVFLVAGPATNIVTMLVVAKSMGKKALAIYLVSIAICSVSMGGALNFFWRHLGFEGAVFYHRHAGKVFPEWITLFFSGLLLVLILRDILLRAGKAVKASLRR